MNFRVVRVDGSETTIHGLNQEYPDLVIYDSSGFALTPEDIAKWNPHLRTLTGRVALIWEDEEASVGDDGSGAIAEIIMEEESE